MHLRILQIKSFIFIYIYKCKIYFIIVWMGAVCHSILV